MYDEVYSGVSAQLSIYCGGTSAIAPAIEVLDFYCSAAKNELVVTVTDSASYSYPTASRESRTRPSGVQETSGGNTNNADESQGRDGDGGGGGSLSRGSIIAVAVVVSVAGIIAIVSAVWFFRRRSKRQAAAAVQGGASNYLGQPELARNMLPNDQSPQELSNEQSPKELSSEQSPKELSNDQPPKELAGSPGVVSVQARPVQVQELDANEKIQR